MKFLARRHQRIEGISFTPMYETDDPEEIERLKNSAWLNSRFWIIPDNIEDTEETQPVETASVGEVGEVQNLKDIPWLELRKLAKEKGVKIKPTMKREQLIAAIKEIDNGNQS